MVLVAVLGAGCGKPAESLAPVAGKVTVGNEKVTSGQVTLIPQDGKQHTDPSAGNIENGEYTIFTGGKEGAPFGKYKVTVNIPMMPSGTNKPPIMPFDRKFADAQKTPLTIEVVSSPNAGAYDLKLTK
jgi:hypothetical protein